MTTQNLLKVRSRKGPEDLEAQTRNVSMRDVQPRSKSRCFSLRAKTGIITAVCLVGLMLVCGPGEDHRRRLAGLMDDSNYVKWADSVNDLWTLINDYSDALCNADAKVKTSGVEFQVTFQKKRELGFWFSRNEYTRKMPRISETFDAKEIEDAIGFKVTEEGTVAGSRKHRYRDGLRDEQIILKIGTNKKYQNGFIGDDATKMNGRDEILRKIHEYIHIENEKIPEYSSTSGVSITIIFANPLNTIFGFDIVMDDKKLTTANVTENGFADDEKVIAGLEIASITTKTGRQDLDIDILRKLTEDANTVQIDVRFKIPDWNYLWNFQRNSAWRLDSRFEDAFASGSTHEFGLADRTETRLKEAKWNYSNKNLYVVEENEMLKEIKLARGKATQLQEQMNKVAICICEIDGSRIFYKDQTAEKAFETATSNLKERLHEIDSEEEQEALNDLFTSKLFYRFCFYDHQDCMDDSVNEFNQLRTNINEFVNLKRQMEYQVQVAVNYELTAENSRKVKLYMETINNGQARQTVASSHKQGLTALTPNHSADDKRTYSFRMPNKKTELDEFLTTWAALKAEWAAEQAQAEQEVADRLAKEEQEAADRLAKEEQETADKLAKKQKEAADRLAKKAEGSCRNLGKKAEGTGRKSKL